MTVPVALRRAGTTDRPVIERLVQLEQHDLSDVTGELPGDDGRFPVAGLDRFFDEPGCSAYVVDVDGTPGGFALVRPVEGASFVHSFFVVRSLRRRGVGATAAQLLLATDGGPWTIAFVERYDAAARFWRAVVDGLPDAGIREETRTHAGEAFAWLTVTR